MTVEAITPIAIFTVSGIGPYGIEFSYDAGAISVVAEKDGIRTTLAETEFGATPASSDTQGDIYLMPAAAATHAGATLIVARTTPDEQGWQGVLGERERGLEVQLDRIVRGMQELRRGVNSSFRLDVPIDPGTSIPGHLLIFTEDGFKAGPDASDIADAQANAAAATAAAAAAAASAGAAAAYDPTLRFKSVEAMRLSYRAPAGEGTIWQAGDTLFSEAGPSATDHHETNLGGAKLYDLTPLHDLEHVSQRLYALPEFGDNIRVPEIYPGSRYVVQGVAFLKVGAQEKLFIVQRNSGANYSSDERCRISEWNISSAGASTLVQFSQELNLGHPQDLSVTTDGSSITLWCSNPTEVGYEGTNSGKGFSKIQWRGASTAQSDVTGYQLFGYAGSGHRYENHYKAMVSVSEDEKYLILNVDEDYSRYGLIYDLQEVIAAPNPMLVDPIGSLPMPNMPYNGGSTVQGLHCDGNVISVLRGIGHAFSNNSIEIYDMQGNNLSTMYLDGIKAMYGEEGLLNHPTLGSPASIEPEGITRRGNGLICGYQMVWYETADVVSDGGMNFACIAENSVGNYPSDQSYWVRTTKPVTLDPGDPSYTGAFDPGRTYNRGPQTGRFKGYYEVSAPLFSGVNEPLGSGMVNRLSTADQICGNNRRDISFVWNNALQVVSYDDVMKRYLAAFEYSGNQLRVYDTRAGSNNGKYTSIKANFGDDGTREVGEFRAVGGSLSDGAGINLYGGGDANFPDWIRFLSGGLIPYEYNPAEKLTKITGALTVTGAVRLSRPTYADNAAAIADGLSVGDDYVTASGEVRVVV